MMSRILIIEDDPGVRDLLRELLVRDGHEVVEAADGRAGIRLYREQGADLAITDIVMPEQEGLETIRQLRAEFPDVKIIAISGELMDDFDPLAVAKKLGALRTFAKPFDLNGFLSEVREVLRA